MRSAVILGIIVGLLGCGEVEPIGDAGTGTGGSGMAGTGMGGGSGGGTGGAGGATPKPCDDTCDTACNTCVNNVCTPKAEDTTCGVPECGGPPITTAGWTYPSIGYKYACRVGVCTKLVNVDCAGFTCTSCSVESAGAPGCFTYDDLGNETGTTQCRCVQTGKGSFCPR